MHCVGASQLDALAAAESNLECPVCLYLYVLLVELQNATHALARSPLYGQDCRSVRIRLSFDRLDKHGKGHSLWRSGNLLPGVTLNRLHSLLPQHVLLEQDTVMRLKVHRQKGQRAL